MPLDPSLLELMPDTITLEPWTGFSVTQAPTYGASVSHKAQVVSQWEKVINKDGREVKSNTRVIIQDRVNIDPRDRITLPTGWVPNQPPIIAIRPVGGVVSMALDSTEILL